MNVRAARPALDRRLTARSTAVLLFPVSDSSRPRWPNFFSSLYFLFLFLSHSCFVFVFFFGLFWHRVVLFSSLPFCGQYARYAYANVTMKKHREFSNTTDKEK